MQRSIGVTLSAVLVFIGCGFTLMFLALGVLGAALAAQQTLNIPIMHAFLIAEVLFGAGFVAWGVASGVGLLKLREWARISMLVFSAMMVFFSLVPLAIFMFLPIPGPPGTPPNFMLFMRIGIGLFYGFFAALGAFWIYFFNRRSVRQQFKPVSAEGPDLVTGSAPILTPVLVDVTPHTPILIIVVAIFFLIGSCVFPFIYILHSPLFFFGVELHGKAAGAYLLLFAGLSLAAGVGLLRVRFWGWGTALAYQLLGLINMACFVFNPGATGRMVQAIAQYEASRGMPEAPRGFPLSAIMWTSFLFGMVVGIAILWVLFVYKKAFSRESPAAI